MPTNTYVALSTQTVAVATPSVTFTSIPQGYTDLVLVLNGSASANSDFFIAFNNDSGTNYSRTVLFGNGSSAGSQRDSNLTRMQIGSVYPNQVNILHIQNYSNTTTNKTVLSRANGPANVVEANVGLYRSTSAITTLVLSLSGSSTFSTGSTFTIYGILAGS